jgi:transketolase
MAHAGYFDISVLDTLRTLGSPLQGHPHREFLPALETSSGPLGSGLSQAVGMALADRIDNGRETGKLFFCLMGDGETNEGQIWEAAMLASKHALGNLICIIDRNNIQIDGHTQDVMPLEPYREKWESFGFHVLEIDGHNIEEIADAIEQGRAVFQKPTVIIAHTISAKGVNAWERHHEWHGKAPNTEEARMAIAELEK